MVGRRNTGVDRRRGTTNRPYGQASDQSSTSSRYGVDSSRTCDCSLLSLATATDWVCPCRRVAHIPHADGSRNPFDQRLHEPRGPIRSCSPRYNDDHYSRSQSGFFDLEPQDAESVSKRPVFSMSRIQNVTAGKPSL